MKNIYYSWCKLITLSCLTLLFRTSDSTVIIIGAGPAGIAAATRLLKNNVSDILILEAEDRIGGRVRSVEFGNALVDLGAEWCHGQENNIVYELVKDYKILGHSDSSSDIYYSNGEKVDEKFSEKLFEIIGNIYGPDGDKDQDEGINLEHYCINEYLSAISDLKLNDSEHVRIAHEFVDFFQGYVLSSEGSFSWSYPSAESDYRDCPGDLAQNWNGLGFKTVLDVMMEKFPNTSVPLPIDGKIIFNKEVEEIIWDSEDHDVAVKCSDASWYYGKQVLFTPSLGVLKQKHRTMFEPQLPHKKRLAIERLGIGAVLKIMLLFPKRWWPEDFQGANLMWSNEHKKAYDEFRRFKKIGKGVNRKAWLFGTLAFIPVANNPNVLSLWFTGKSVPVIEQLDSTELLDGINYILKTFLGKTYKLSYPISYVKSQWYTNPHFRGTYSYQTTASRQTTSNEDLAAPLSNRNGKLTLLFAGEATHPHYYSTVHGAIETGHREADRILKMLNVR